MNAWVIPGIKIPPASKSQKDFAEIVLNILCEKYSVERSFLETNKTTKNPAPSGIKRRSRREDRVYMRQMFYFCMRELFKSKAGYIWLGSIFKQDHTTVMYSVKVFKNYLDTNRRIPEKIASYGFKKSKTVKEDYSDLLNKVIPWL